MAGYRTAEQSTEGMCPNVSRISLSSSSTSFVNCIYNDEQVVSGFPPLAEVRSVAERIKTLDPEKVVLAANRGGQVKLAMSNESVKVETTWHGLKHGDDEVMADVRSEPLMRFKSIRVDLKALSKLLSCQLPEHETEFWIYARACASFVVSQLFLSQIVHLS